MDPWTDTLLIAGYNGQQSLSDTKKVQFNSLIKHESGQLMVTEIQS